MGRYVVATVDEIPPGSRKTVDIEGRSVGVFNVGGEFFALRNSCPHQGGPLCTGVLWGYLDSPAPGEYAYSRAGEMLRCPWHGWEYDIRTGQSWFDPDRKRVRSYEVTVETGDRLIGDPAAPAPGLEKGPYIAETYPVSVEQRYIVVTIET